MRHMQTKAPPPCGALSFLQFAAPAGRTAPNGAQPFPSEY
ncbi:hypothetical protein 3S15_25 [uncultured Caudovirales phage]|uniref:Uncharacterized protein n=1 Tax=uncultured Caudovirales phage TaxID=2100421 RepID=A0A2H4JHB9_9CAUD|nr:hypothetical protein 3S15_25 [uncultured Caudovirales phage]